MTKLQECLAQNMKHYRKLRHLTQESLAERIGTSTNYIGIIETGGSFPSPQMIEKIAEALEIDSPQLFADKGGQTMNTLKIDELRNILMKNIETAINESLQIQYPSS